MRRREFITLLGGAVVAWPLAAHAQQPPKKMRRLGVLQPGAPPDPLVEAMQGRLRELGYSEGRDVAFEFRWAEGKLDRLPQLATELADLKVCNHRIQHARRHSGAESDHDHSDRFLGGRRPSRDRTRVESCPSGRKCDRLVSAGYGVGCEAARNP